MRQSWLKTLFSDLAPAEILKLPSRVAYVLEAERARQESSVVDAVEQLDEDLSPEAIETTFDEMRSFVGSRGRRRVEAAVTLAQAETNVDLCPALRVGRRYALVAAEPQGSPDVGEAPLWVDTPPTIVPEQPEEATNFTVQRLLHLGSIAQAVPSMKFAASHFGNALQQQQHQGCISLRSTKTRAKRGRATTKMEGIYSPRTSSMTQSLNEVNEVEDESPMKE